MKPVHLLLMALWGCQFPTTPQPAQDALSRVAAIHGGSGPWAVAGYRMGTHALQVLGLPRGSFDLLVTHHTPQLVQYSCVADGAAAATGASAGKLNLKLQDATTENVHTVYTNKVTGQSITLRPSASFAARFKDLPREKLGEAGAQVMTLSDAEVFEVVP